MSDRRHLEHVPLDDLESALVNPKLHDAELIESSMDRFGFMEIPVLDERTGRLVAGHGRRDQLRELRDTGQPPPEGVEVDDEGRWLVPTVRGWASVDDHEAHAAGIALNRGAEAGGWDDRVLTDTLREMNDANPDFGLVGTGYDPMVLANLLMVTRTAAEVADFDAAAEWVGLPDYEAELVPWKLVVNFVDNATRERFLDELGVRDHITFTHGDKRTVSAWFPVRDAPVHDTGLRWEDMPDPLADLTAGDLAAGLASPADLPPVGAAGGGTEGSLDGREGDLAPPGEIPTPHGEETALDPASGPLVADAPGGPLGDGGSTEPGEAAAYGTSDPLTVP